MFHFCADEAMAISAAIGCLPFIGPILRARFSRWKQNRAPHCCDHNHTNLEKKS